MTGLKLWEVMGIPFVLLSFFCRTLLLLLCPCASFFKFLFPQSCWRTSKAACQWLDFSQALIETLKMISFGKLRENKYRAEGHWDAFSQALIAAPYVTLLGLIFQFVISWKRCRATCHCCTPQVLIAVVKETTSITSTSLRIWNDRRNRSALGHAYGSQAAKTAVRPFWSNGICVLAIPSASCKTSRHCNFSVSSLCPKRIALL